MLGVQIRRALTDLARDHRIHGFFITGGPWPYVIENITGTEERYSFVEMHEILNRIGYDIRLGERLPGDGRPPGAAPGAETFNLRQTGRRLLRRRMLQRRSAQRRATSGGSSGWSVRYRSWPRRSSPSPHGPGDHEIPHDGSFLDLPRPTYGGGPLFDEDELSRLGKLTPEDLKRRAPALREGAKKRDPGPSPDPSP
jgi:hypothetical protein